MEERTEEAEKIDEEDAQTGEINPLSPHDALKHHFTFLKTDLIFL